MVCVAFLEVDARFPEGRGTFFDLMDGAASRGIDVRVLFWHPEGHAADAEVVALGASGSRLRGDRGDSPLHHRPAHPCIIAVFTPASARCQRARASRHAMQCPDCPR